MEAISDYKYFGLWAFVILVAGLVFTIWKWPAENHLTFSQRVALQKQSIIYYVCLFSIVLPLLLTFIIGWFAPSFQLSVWFSIFVIVASFLQYTATLIPEIGGWKTKVHRHISGISGVCLVPPLLILLFTDSLSPLGKVSVILGLILMLGMIVFANVTKKERYEVSYIHQSIFYAGFFIPILVVSYLLV